MSIKFSEAKCASNYGRIFIVHTNRLSVNTLNKLIATLTHKANFHVCLNFDHFLKNQCFETNILNALILDEIATKPKRDCSNHIQKIMKGSFVDVNILALGARTAARTTLWCMPINYPEKGDTICLLDLFFSSKSNIFMPKLL